MSAKSSLLLIGVGGAGCAAVRGVNRATGGGMRYLLTDTDASSGGEEDPFLLLGGDRLSGHGSGGDFAMARLAAEDSLDSIDEYLDAVRLVIMVSCLGGGTGSGATLALERRLQDKGIPVILFATLPFAFEGDEKRRNANGVVPAASSESSASFILPMDRLVPADATMEDGLRQATDTLASAIALFWRLVEKPGYIRLDVERLRHIVKNAGNAHFAVATAQGPSRAEDVVDALSRSPLLASPSGATGAILCGVLAGIDLRLAEIGTIASGIRSAFGERCQFDLATVNDEETFSGRISVVLMLFESGADAIEQKQETQRRTSRKTKGARNPLAVGPQGRGRFNNVEPTVWFGEDLDVPTFTRRNVQLEL